jgi:hypothetical protein
MSARSSLLIYRSKGLTQEEAEILADRLISKREPLPRTDTEQELQLDAGQFGSTAWVAAGSSFALFALGAIFPVLLFFFVSGGEAIASSIALSAVVLFLIGFRALHRPQSDVLGIAAIADRPGRRRLDLRVGRPCRRNQRRLEMT